MTDIGIGEGAFEVVTAITRGDQEGAMRTMCDHIVTVRVEYEMYAFGLASTDGFELPRPRMSPSGPDRRLMTCVGYRTHQRPMLCGGYMKLST